ncbi:ankyrin repeat-containing protein BDA1-like [Gossypium arboreum]|uniref:Ankyrin repeat-containing protein BDA1-like n=1 Tax=Gossypium arboreum TaxID=29729 RepID=A0ABR0NL29_GOSAR|nr:ankyrin repeat-containing protein BDA1-like [Gossypium arboreum]KAK5795306.1 hypothetical protein PVK06_036567 [Gossypium arboreum]
MDERMIEAAQTGDIDLLYELIQNDPYVLQRIDDVPFFHTPLHVAAAADRVDFMMEMINLKPSFARKLNQAGFSPMHLALQDNRTQAVLQLLKFDKGLVRIKGREGFTPLHHVVQTGNVDLLIKLLKVCPEAIEDVTVRDETVFHLAVKNDMFEAFKLLVGWLIRSHHESAQRWEKELLSWADINGNTVLHIAAIRNRPRVVDVLLEHLHRYQINAKNLEGLTALDIQSQYPWNERQADRIIDMLSNAGGLSGSSSSLPNTSFASIYIKSSEEKTPWYLKWATRAGGGKKGMPHEMRNTFLVVTVLIITTTYEASLNPPKTPDDSPCPSLKYQVSLSQDQPLNSHTFLHKTDINTAPIPSPSAMDVSQKGDWTSEYSLFWFYNTLTFWAAVFLTVLLLPPHSLSLLILLTLGFFGRSYMNLFEVSSWSWEHSFEFSNKKAHFLYGVASVSNLCSSTLLVFLGSYQTMFYVCRRVNITKSNLFFHVQIVQIVAIGYMIFIIVS